MSAALLVGLSLATTAFHLWPGLRAGPSSDAAVFMTTGWLVGNGRAPYLEAWDHKPPVIYYLDAAAVSIPGIDPWLGVWVLSVVLVAVVAVMVGLTVRRFASPLLAAAAAIATASALAQYPVSLGGGLTEHAAAVPLAAAWLIGGGEGRSAWRSGVIGILLGVALLTSTQAVAGIGAIGLLLLMRGGLAPAAVALAGLIGVLAVAVVGAAMAGILPAAWDALVVYQTAYRGANVDVDSTASVATAVLALLFLVVPLLLAFVRGRRLWRSDRPLVLSSAVWLLGTMAVSVAAGRFEIHYLAIAVIPAVTLGAIALAGIELDGRRGERGLVAVLVGCAAIVSVVVSVGATTPLRASIRAENDRVALLADRLLTGPSGPIVVWGLEPQLYLEANRQPAGRYSYLYPLTTPGYSDAVQVADELARWEAAAPAIVIDAGSFAPGEPGAPPLLIDRPVDFDGRELDLLDPLRDFVRDGYRLMDVVDGWPVYERVSS